MRRFPAVLRNQALQFRLRPALAPCLRCQLNQTAELRGQAERRRVERRTAQLCGCPSGLRRFWQGGKPGKIGIFRPYAGAQKSFGQHTAKIFGPVGQKRLLRLLPHPLAGERRAERRAASDRRLRLRVQ